MNADDIERGRKIVDRDGWNIIWIGAKMPCEFFDEEIEEYAIVSKNTTYGLSRYDHIVRNADKVKEEQT